jgi:hypothetical protein
LESRELSEETEEKDRSQEVKQEERLEGDGWNISKHMVNSSKTWWHTPPQAPSQEHLCMADWKGQAYGEPSWAEVQCGQEYDLGNLVEPGLSPSFTPSKLFWYHYL